MSTAAHSQFALSVVVCTYNNAALLAETLRHLAAQEKAGDAFEVLLIDNNCTDDTPRVVEDFATQIPHLRRVVETQQGQMHARVRGVRESRAPWVAFVDDDNFLAPGWIAAALERIAASPKCGVFGSKVVIDWETAPAEVVARRAYAYAETDLGAEARCLAGEARWQLRGAGLVCRKEALESCGWLDWQACVGRAGRGTMSGDDTEIVMRIVRAGYEAWYEPACELRHRIAGRRLGWDYLRSLHFSFALADPILLGFHDRGSMTSWAGRMFMLLLRRTYWLFRHALRGLISADARATTALTFDTLHGALRGIVAVARLDKRQRDAWLQARSFSTANCPLRVVHVQNGGLYGGVERMLACLAAERECIPEVEPVFAFCYSARLADEIRKTGARVETLGPVRTSRPWQWALAAWRFFRLLGSERFDAVIAHGSWPLAHFGFCAKLRGVPLVLWMHNDTKVRYKNFGETLAALTRPDLVIANSAFTAASLPLLFRQPPPHVVLPCPVSAPSAEIAAGKDRASLRRELSTDGDAVVVVIAGRPEPWKGHAELLTALAHMKGAQPWVCWVIGGAFTAEQTAFLAALEAQVRALGIADRVRFVGQRADVAELLSAADLFCQPNVTPEPFGIVFVEALYAGLPVVTSDHGGGREIVNATCGRLVPPGDAAALAAALEQLVGDASRRQMLSSEAPRRGDEVSAPARVLPALRSALLRLHSGDAKQPASAALSPNAELHLSPHG